MVIAIAGLIGLTSCSTTKADSEVIKGFIEEMPEMPDLPTLSWSYQNELYCLSETDVDKLLNYGENELPNYQYQLKLWKDKLDIILNHL